MLFLLREVWRFGLIVEISTEFCFLTPDTGILVWLVTIQLFMSELRRIVWSWITIYNNPMQLVPRLAFAGLHFYLLTIAGASRRTWNCRLPVAMLSQLCLVWCLVVVSPRVFRSGLGVIIQNTLLCGKFVSRPPDFHSREQKNYSCPSRHKRGIFFKMNTSTFGQIISCTDFKFGRFVAYITNLSLHYGAEYKGFEHYMHWICFFLSLVLCQKIMFVLDLQCTS